MLPNEVQPLNTYLLRAFNPAGSSTDFSAVQFWKAYSPMESTEAGRQTVSNAHCLNAPLPIVVSVDGSSTLEREVHSRNMYSPITVAPSSNRTLCRLVQPVNTAISMLSTPDGMTMDCKAVQPLNASDLIVVTLSPIAARVRPVQPWNMDEGMVVVWPDTSAVSKVDVFHGHENP